MLAQFVSLIALASAAVAIPAPAPISAASIGTSLTAAFDARLAKRQSTTDGLTGLQNLLQQAVQGQSSGKCKSECEPWITTVTSCVNDNGSDNTAIGLCSCGSTPVGQMKTCGACFDEAQAADDFGSLCAAATGGSGTGSGSGSLSSGSASASRSSSIAASSGGGFLSSASSRVSSAVGSVTSGFASATSAASFSTGAGTGAATGAGNGASQATSAGGAAATSAPASGAERNAIVAGSALGFAALVGALLV